ncbi:hypothetical protein B0H17DRAFT_1133866 [Mycena rosella]|uniref:F-box domain-containing protein n=1 Tax=Mycena rosella TaxID=1033263 RepID=A0AAD7GJ00_MYCRO|nr:hypothetical protein B0H17DRAFT_1133866 [Mycena rosella]
MANQSKLTSIPADVQHHLLSFLPDFYDLGALILTSRCFHDVYQSRRKILLDEVAQNLLGCLFDEATLLARAQEAKYGLGDASVKGFSSDTVLLVVNNDYITPESRHDSIYDAESLERFVEAPFTSEMISRFLKMFPPNELLELSHFVRGISNLVYAMRRQPQESDHDWDFVASVLSTGPENVLRLWVALQQEDADFELDLDGAGCNGEEGFFDYPVMEVMETSGLGSVSGVYGLEPIFDGDSKKMEEVLRVHLTRGEEEKGEELFLDEHLFFVRLGSASPC